MRRKLIDYLINIILLFLFLIVGTIGIIIFPDLLKIFGLNLNLLPKVELYKYHHWLGLLLLIFSSIHIDRYWKILTNSLRTIILKPKKSNSNKFKLFRIKTILNLLLLISLILVLITGVLKFPGFLPFIGLSPISIPLNLISLIHDYFGLIAFISSLIHIAFYAKRLLKNTKKSNFKNER